MKTLRNALSIAVVLTMLLSFGMLSYADSEDDESYSQDSSVQAEWYSRGTNNDCLWSGTVSLVNPSGRVLVIQTDVIAYHVVDRIGYTVYLQRKATVGGDTSTIKTYTGYDLNSGFVGGDYQKTVTQSGYYRLLGSFSTRHSIHQTEGGTAVTSWMWVD